MYSRIPMRSTSRFSKNGDFLNDLQKQKVIVVFVSMEGCPHCDAYAPKWNLLEKECSKEMPGVSLHRIPHTEYEPLEGMIQPDSFPHIEVIHPDPTSSFIPPIREMDVSMDREPETILTILRELSSKQSQSPKTQLKETKKEQEINTKSKPKTKPKTRKEIKKKQKGSSRKTLKQSFQLKQSKGSKRSYMSKKQEGKGIVDNLLTTFGLGRQQSLSQNQSQQQFQKVSNLSNQVLQRHNQLNESILNQYQSK
jgi:hypothetical protein